MKAKAHTPVPQRILDGAGHLQQPAVVLHLGGSFAASGCQYDDLMQALPLLF